MKLTKNLTIALDAIAHIRKSGTPVSAAEVATVTGGTLSFVQQVMHRLGTAGIVKSVRGPGGGYTVSPDKVNAYNVALALGCAFPTLSLDATPVQTLERTIIETFVNTAV